MRYNTWLKESKFLIITEKDDKIISVVKNNEKIDYIKTIGYFGVYNSNTCLHTYYINPIKCKFVNKLLKSAYEFDYNNFICRCRKEKLKKINDYVTIH